MNRYRLAKLLVITAALNFNGCGGAASTAGDKTAVAPSTANTATPAPTAGTAATPAANVPAAADTAARPGTVPAPEARNAGIAPPAAAPTPQIGSGGNDLFLFTQARAAVNADPDLKAANLSVEVKEGVVTLNGTVASAALKARAEELARGIRPKDVRNQLRVSAGK